MSATVTTAARPRKDQERPGTERPRTSSPPDLAPGVAAGARAVFGALSRLRGARIFHPRGVGYDATLVVEARDPRYEGVRLLKRPGEHRAVVRFSRAAGLPEPLPDVLGLGIRVVDLYGPARHQDFLLVTSADAPLLHHLLLPAPGGFTSQSYSSILPYRIGDRLCLVGAQPEAARELEFQLGLAPLGGRLSPVATLRIGDRIDDAAIENLALNPWNSAGGIQPVGPLQGVRRAAYAGSQRGRGLRAEEVP